MTGDSKIKFMSDTKTGFSKGIGWMAGMGDRTGRYAIIVEKDGTVSYAEIEKSPREVSVSQANPSSTRIPLIIARSLARTLCSLAFRYACAVTSTQISANFGYCR